MPKQGAAPFFVPVPVPGPPEARTDKSPGSIYRSRGDDVKLWLRLLLSADGADADCRCRIFHPLVFIDGLFFIDWDILSIN